MRQCAAIVSSQIMMSSSRRYGVATKASRPPTQAPKLLARSSQPNITPYVFVWHTYIYTDENLKYLQIKLRWQSGSTGTGVYEPISKRPSSLSPPLAVTGPVLGVARHDVKKVLPYHRICHAGSFVSHSLTCINTTQIDNVPVLSDGCSSSYHRKPDLGPRLVRLVQMELLVAWQWRK